MKYRILLSFTFAYDAIVEILLQSELSAASLQGKLVNFKGGPCGEGGGQGRALDHPPSHGFSRLKEKNHDKKNFPFKNFSRSRKLFLVPGKTS